MATVRQAERFDLGWVLTHGIVGGILAGIIFAVAEMLGGRFIAGNPLLMPLKAFASVPLGDKPPDIATSTAVPVGLVTHMILSAAFGVVFAFVVAAVDALRSSAVALVVVASVYGTLLWLVNFYLIAPAIGRPWFSEMPALQQFVYHTVFFGTVLGLYLAAVRSRLEAPAR